MYKKLIALVLIFVLMFNFISNNVVYAMPAVLVGYGLIAFAAALTAYGVIVTDNQHVKLLYEQFQNWSDSTGLTEYMQNSYYQNKMMMTGIPIGVAALGLGLNTWIRTQFNKGYNELKIGENAEHKGIYNNIRWYVVPGAPVGNGQIWIEWTIGNVKGILGSFYPGDVWSISNVTFYNRTNPPNTVNVSFDWTCNGEMERIVNCSLSGQINTNVEYPEEYNINYYASEAVDYPVGRNPEDRDINLPPPNLGSPNLTYDGQDYIYTGTPEQFLDEYSNDQDYIDKAFDSVLDNTKSISQPIVNTSAGTITWTNTGVIDYPLNPPIVNPPITVPETAEQGIGATNSILTGISEYVGNIFAAPTKTIDFNPLMQISLTDRFPFCLPFDLRDIIQKFQADRKAPEFEIGWKVKNAEVKYKMEFERFERLAEITRWGSFLTFVVGLIMVSRKLIGGE